MSATVREPSHRTSTPDRGAPFAGYLVLGLLLGLLIANDVHLGPWVFLIVLPYVVLASRWNHALWRSRWSAVADRGTAQEDIAFWTTVVLLLVASIASLQGDDAVPWVAFAGQVAIAAVIVPATLKRYPGVIVHRGNGDS